MYVPPGSHFYFIFWCTLPLVIKALPCNNTNFFYPVFFFKFIMSSTSKSKKRGRSDSFDISSADIQKAHMQAKMESSNVSQHQESTLSLIRSLMGSAMSIATTETVNGAYTRKVDEISTPFKLTLSEDIQNLLKTGSQARVYLNIMASAVKLICPAGFALFKNFVLFECMYMDKTILVEMNSTFFYKHSMCELELIKLPSKYVGQTKDRYAVVSGTWRLCPLTVDVFEHILIDEFSMNRSMLNRLKSNQYDKKTKMFNMSFINSNNTNIIDLNLLMKTPSEELPPHVDTFIHQSSYSRIYYFSHLYDIFIFSQLRGMSFSDSHIVDDTLRGKDWWHFFSKWHIMNNSKSATIVLLTPLNITAENIDLTLKNFNTIDPDKDIVKRILLWIQNIMRKNSQFSKDIEYKLPTSSELDKINSSSIREYWSVFYDFNAKRYRDENFRIAVSKKILIKSIMQIEPGKSVAVVYEYGIFQDMMTVAKTFKSLIESEKTQDPDVMFFDPEFPCVRNNVARVRGVFQKMDEWQKKVLYALTKRRLAFIQGRAGAGKTFIADVILNSFKKGVAIPAASYGIMVANLISKTRIKAFTLSKLGIRLKSAQIDGEANKAPSVAEPKEPTEVPKTRHSRQSTLNSMIIKTPAEQINTLNKDKRDVDDDHDDDDVESIHSKRSENSSDLDGDLDVFNSDIDDDDDEQDVCGVGDNDELYLNKKRKKTVELLPASVLVIDEFSTVKYEELAYIMRNMPSLKAIYFFGDPNQMQSIGTVGPHVGWCNIFKTVYPHEDHNEDFTHKDGSLYRSFYLSKIYRQQNPDMMFNFDCVIRNQPELIRWKIGMHHIHDIENAPWVFVQSDAELNDNNILQLYTPLCELYINSDDQYMRNDLLVITQQNIVKERISKIILNMDKKYKKIVQTSVSQKNIFAVGQFVMFLQNDYGSDPSISITYKYDKQTGKRVVMRKTNSLYYDGKKEKKDNRDKQAKYARAVSEPVMNKECLEIRQILDIDKFSGQIHQKPKHTGVLYPHGKNTTRIVVFKDPSSKSGRRQINLDYYSIENITTAAVSTISSTQGRQSKIVCVHIPGTVNSRYMNSMFTREQFYTAVTRCEKQVIVIAPSLQEIKNIINRDPVICHDPLVGYMREYIQK